MKRLAAATIERVGMGSTIARNSVFLLAGEALARAINLFISVALYRSLGPAGAGGLAIVVKYGILFGVIAEFGLTRAAVLEIGRLRAEGLPEEDALSTVLGRTAVLRSLTGLLCLALTGLSLLIPPGVSKAPELKPLIILWICSLIFQAFRRNAEVAFQASQKLHYHALFLVAARLLAMLAVGGAILTGRGLPAVIVAYVITDFVDACTSNLFAWRRIAWPRFHTDGRALLALAVVGIPFALQLLANQIYYYIDTPMLEALLPGTEERVKTEIGNYNCAQQVVLTLMFIPVSVCSAIFPVVNRAWHASDMARVRSLTSYSLKLLLLTGPALALGFFLFREEFIRIVFPAYGLAVPMLAVIVWTIPLAFAAGALSGLLAATGAQRVVTFSAFANAAFNVTLNWFLIPRFGGVGTSAATAATEGFCLLTMLAAVVAIRRGLMGASALGPLVFFQGGALAVMIGMVDGTGLGWRIVFFGLYGAVCACWMARAVRERRVGITN